MSDPLKWARVCGVEQQVVSRIADALEHDLAEQAPTETGFEMITQAGEDTIELKTVLDAVMDERTLEQRFDEAREADRQKRFGDQP